MKMMVCAERIDPVLVLPFADVTVCLLILHFGRVLLKDSQLPLVIG